MTEWVDNVCVLHKNTNEKNYSTSWIDLIKLTYIRLKIQINM
jgi:hypothetical protein